MQRLEVSGAVRPIYGSSGVKRLMTSYSMCQPTEGCHQMSIWVNTIAIMMESTCTTFLLLLRNSLSG